jgi:hypothetical protein
MKSILFLIPLVQAGEVVWDGFFNSSFTVDQFDKCKLFMPSNSLPPQSNANALLGSWSNPVGSYQWYIHGSEATSNYLEVSPGFKNPADTSDDKGIRISIVRLYAGITVAPSKVPH